MIPEKLTISGFLSYQEPTEIDFSGLHVACITGQNGAGKSAMLDAITWALFGEARRSDDSVINDVVENKTAKVDFEFIYEDTAYRVSRQKTRGKSTIAELFVLDPLSGSWKAMTEKRVTDTNKKIRDTLHMDYKTFINASFFLQGKADQFTGQNATERKKVLGTILNLEVWEEYKNRAAEKRKKVENQISGLDISVREAENELAEEPARRARLAEVEEQLGNAETRQKTAELRWEAANEKMTALGQMKNYFEQKQRDTQQRLRQIQNDRQELDKLKQSYTLLKARLEHAEEIEQQYNELGSLRTRIEAFTRAAQQLHGLESERNEILHRISMEEQRLRGEQRHLALEAQNIEKELSKRDTLAADQQRLESQIRQYASVTASRSETEKKRDEIHKQGDILNGRLLFIENQTNDISARLEKLRNAPSGICPTCGQEMDEIHRAEHVAELEQSLQKAKAEHLLIINNRGTLRTQYTALNKQVQELIQKENELTGMKVRLESIAESLAGLNSKYADWEQNGKLRLASLEDTLRSKSYCQSEQQSLLAVEEKIVSLAYDREAHEKAIARSKALAGAEQRYQDLISSRSRIEPLEQNIHSREAHLEEDSGQLRELQKDLQEAEAAYTRAKADMPDLPAADRERKEALQEVNRLHIEEGKARQLVSSLDGIRIRLKQYNDSLTEKRALAERYKTLEKAFGKDGIPALLIEQAIPEIEEQANDLLQQLSNGNMTVHLITQGEYKGRRDDVKETLEILISDPYGVREYEMFSGGEAFRINFSLRLALSRMLAQRAGSRLQTLVIDEGFGSQDDEGRARLAEAITTVQKDFEKILVITHLSELKETFPARIEVSKTANGSSAEVIL